MTTEEKNTWAYGLIAVVGYAIYLVVVLDLAVDPITETPYVTPMLFTIGGGIVAGIVVGGVIHGTSAKDRANGRDRDERDQQIYRFGERIGGSFIVIGALAALVLALIDADSFWIANAVYLAFVLSAILSATARIVGYRRGFQAW